MDLHTVNLLVFVTLVVAGTLGAARVLPFAWRTSVLSAGLGLVLAAPLGVWGVSVFGALPAWAPLAPAGVVASQGAEAAQELAASPQTQGAGGAQGLMQAEFGALSARPDSSEAPVAGAAPEAAANPALFGVLSAGPESRGARLLRLTRGHPLTALLALGVLVHGAFLLARWRRGRRVLNGLRLVAPSADVRAAWRRLGARFDGLERLADAPLPTLGAWRARQPSAPPAAGLELVASPDVRTPFVLPGRQPLLVVPAEWPELDGAEIEAVLAHEVGHVCAGHLALLRWQAALRLAFGWHPAALWLDRALERTKETVADQWATRTATERRSLAAALVAFAEAASQPRPALELHLSPLTARVEDLLFDHAGGTELPPPARQRPWQRALVGAGAVALGVSAACTGMRAEGPVADPVAEQQQDHEPGFFVKAWEAQPDGQGPDFVVTRPAWTRPDPAHPDDLEFPGLREEHGLWIYPATRRSVDWIELPPTKPGLDPQRVAIDFRVEDQGVSVALSLMHDLNAIDAATGEVLWQRESSFYYDALRFVDHKDEAGSQRRAVRLEQSGTDARELWAYYDLFTGDELENPFAEPEPEGMPTMLTHWSGDQAVLDEPRRVLVESAAAWRALYAELWGGVELVGEPEVHGGPPLVSALEGAPPFDLGGLDFAQEAVFVHTLGRASNCRGVDLHVAFIDGERVLLRVRAMTYQSMAGPEDDFFEGAVERPWGVFRVPRLSAGELVVERDERHLIRGPSDWQEVGRFAFE